MQTFYNVNFFVFDQIIESGDIIGIIQTVLLVFVSLFPFFVFCHFGGNLTYQFENVGDNLYQLEWYEYPMEVQKRLPIIIASTQKSIYMRGYGDTRSTYSVFKKVIFIKFIEIDRIYQCFRLFYKMRF